MRFLWLRVWLGDACAAPTTTAASAAMGSTPSPNALLSTAAPLPAAASATGTPAPFCVECGFDFGHIIDGVDDRLAGGALVGLVVLLVGLACLLLGRCCCSKTGAQQGKGYDRVTAEEAAAD